MSFDISAFAAAYQNIRLAYDSGAERIVRALSSGALPDFQDLLTGVFIQTTRTRQRLVARSASLVPGAWMRLSLKLRGTF